jgi:hypothetical protein
LHVDREGAGVESAIRADRDGTGAALLEDGEARAAPTKPGRLRPALLRNRPADHRKFVIIADHGIAQARGVRIDPARLVPGSATTRRDDPRRGS